MPWLGGLSQATASEIGTPSTERRLTDVHDVELDDCAPTAYEAVELVADVSPRPGLETIVGSYAQGVYVFDREDNLIAATPGYICEGTTDAIEVLAAGSNWGVPAIVVVGTTGGRRMSDSWLALYRIDGRGHLTAMFTGVVEERRGGDDRKRGYVQLLPGALFYRTPGGVAELWRFDHVRGTYVPRPRPRGRDHDANVGPVSSL